MNAPQPHDGVRRGLVWTSETLTRRILVNVTVMATSTGVSALVAVLSVAILARYLGVAGYGMYSLVFVCISFARILSQFGTEEILTRDLARRPEAAGLLIGNAIIVRVALALIAIVLWVVFVLLVPEREIGWATAVGMLSLLLWGIYGPMWTAFQARMEHPVRDAIMVIRQIGDLGLIALAIWLRASLLVLVGAHVVAHAVTLGLTIWLSRGRTPIVLRVAPALIRDLLRKGTPLMVASFFSVVYERVDGVLLWWLGSYEALGLYSAAYKLLTLALWLPAVVNVVLLPVLSRIRDDRTTTGLVFQKTFDYLTLLALPVAAGVTLLAPRIITLLYGPGFEPAANALRILIWAAVPLFWVDTCRNVLIAAGLQMRFLWLMMLTTGFNVLLNLWLIPRYGAIGAAWAMVAAAIGASIVAYGLVLRSLNLHVDVRYMLKAAVAAAGMSVLVVGAAPLGFWPALVLGAAAYVLTAAALGLWPTEIRLALSACGPERVV
jgi:O-antigen/teichoic acid export membrane protein